jgi:hypothetical protein
MIVLGADMHKRSHTIAAVDAATGAMLTETTVQVGARGFEEVLVSALALTVLAGAAGAAWLLARDDTPSPPRFYSAGFGITTLDTRQDLTRARRQRRFSITVSDGTCTQEQPEHRLEQVQVHRSRNAVTASVRMRREHPDGDACFGVGIEFPATLALPAPVGRRALVLDAGPYQFRAIVIPPLGRDAARRLVLPIRRDRRQPSPLIYSGPGCDEVARYLRDVPRTDWCSS